MVHAEENAIINAARSGISLKGSTFYITGFPCSRCFRGIINVSAVRIVYGSINSNCISEEDKKAIEIMNQSHMPISVIATTKMVSASLRELYRGCKIDDPKLYTVPKIEFCEYKGDIGKILSQAQDYIKEKCSSKV